MNLKYKKLPAEILSFLNIEATVEGMQSIHHPNVRETGEN